MITCSLDGDSIAVMMHRTMTECAVQAQGGISTAGYVHKFKVKSYDCNIISLTANNFHLKSTESDLRAIRAQLTGQVIWLIPNNNRHDAIEIIYRIAKENKDDIIDTSMFIRYGVHPALESERQGIAAAIKLLEVK